MIRAGFLSPAERRELLCCVRRHREDHGVARRANAILLLGEGERGAQVARLIATFKLPNGKSSPVAQ